MQRQIAQKRKILFVADSIGFMEIFSIPILSAALKVSGHSVKLVEFGQTGKQALATVRAWQPDILAYSLCSTESDRYLEINRSLKRETDALSVFGGPHPTFFPTFVSADGVDAICLGEADTAFPCLVDLLGTEAMFLASNFHFKQSDGTILKNYLSPLIEDLDRMPFPDRDLIYKLKPFLRLNPVKSFFAGRGCPYNCSYCFNHAFNKMYRGKGQILRTKSVDYLLREVQDIARRYPLSFIKFHDDIFGANREWLAEFSEKYPKKVGKPFLCYARPTMIDDEYARLLKLAGCYSVCLAIESGNERIRKDVLKRNMDDRQIVSACERLRHVGLRIYTLNMIGLPGESHAEMLQTVALNRTAKVDFADASIFTPYPGTRLAQYCEEQGYTSEAVLASHYKCSTLNLDPHVKDRIYLLHKLFPLLVDHPRLMPYLETMLRVGHHLGGVFNLVYRFYYGYFLHKRIYASAIPFTVKLRGIVPVLFSRGRT